MKTALLFVLFFLPAVSQADKDLWYADINYKLGLSTTYSDGVNNNLNNIGLGTLNAGQTKTIVIRATVADASQFSVGTASLVNTAQVTSSSNSASAQATVNVNINQVILTCSPINQNVQTNQTATFTVTGGSGGYVWTAPNSTTISGSGSSFVTQYPTATSTKLLSADHPFFVGTAILTIDCIDTTTVGDP